MSIRSGSRKLKLQSFGVPEEDRMNIHNNFRVDADFTGLRVEPEFVGNNINGHV
jgi:hypothetical protein